MRAVVVAVVAACGGSDALAPDAAPALPDAPVADFPACREFSGQASVFVPAHLDGELAGADLASPAGCAIVDAPFGGESAGPDHVVRLRGLRPGGTYVVKLRSASDLQFYVTTGCATPSGPGAEQCLLFVDGSLDETELGRFVATAAYAYVVVDFFASHLPASMAFTLDVYEHECDASAECSTGACNEGRCVACVTAFDCTNPNAPRCDANTHECVAGDAACAYDDDVWEPSDDGPAGARVLALDAAGRATVEGTACSQPRSEADFIAFDVTTIGETWDFQLAWTGGRDLDVQLLDAHGTKVGLSLWEQPERARLTYLPIGRYFVRVTEFSSSGNAAPVAYVMTAQRTLGAGCATAADCASEYRNQIFRGSCTAGACVAIAGAGAIAEGGSCDSQSDCADGLHCPSFYFVAAGDSRETCNRACAGSGECEAGFVCTSYVAENFCVASCTGDDDCPTAPDAPPIAGPWRRLHCDVASGRCLP